MTLPNEIRSDVVIDDMRLHVVSAGDPDGPVFLFLHGWPESSRSWAPVMTQAARHAHTIAVDLPGVGRSTGNATDGSKRQLADAVHRLIATMGLTDVTLVGQDIGGMIAYAYVRAYEDIARAVIMDVVAPGVDPWDEVLRNPQFWHFGLHSVPALPERLVRGRQREYFDFFYDALAADPTTITEDARRSYTRAYATDSALTAGFNWYRAFPVDAEDNRRHHGRPVPTPVLYLRGEHERGDVGTYAQGLRAAGLTRLEHDEVPGVGHFAQEEAPEQTWRLLADFAARNPVGE
jgi:pimeloyl-ACP methyl ester carboxylesterase